MSKRRLPNLRVGDLVEVRSADEILGTLDENGELENLPFMPEMLQYCGKRMRVHKVAHKLCDTISATGLHWMNSAVHLKDARCDGMSHGGCQTGCLFYWKESWLRRVTETGDSRVAPVTKPIAAERLSVLHRAARKPPGEEGEERFACQATELLRAAPTRIRFWHLWPYVADVRAGNVGLATAIKSILLGLFNAYQGRSKRYLPKWLQIKDGMPWGFVKGSNITTTPSLQLNLKPGDLVRIRPKEQIMQTLNGRRLNRGMGFEEQMARSCGRTARVDRRVERCIHEKTGRMLTMKDSCIVLEGVICDGIYHGNCPREFIPFWREIWLEPLGTEQSVNTSKGPHETA